jgi:hypothetical protein
MLALRFDALFYLQLLIRPVHRFFHNPASSFVDPLLDNKVMIHRDEGKGITSSGQEEHAIDISAER